METMLQQLRANPLGNAGLVEALRKQCEALGFRSGATVEFKVGTLPPPRSLSPGAQEALFRAGQEALANVARHARATNVAVSWGLVGHNLQVRVADNGAGFDTNRDAGGMGIANMRERMRESGGVFEVVSCPGGGATVTLSVPFIVESATEYLRRARNLSPLLLLVLVYGVVRGSLLMGVFGVFCAIQIARALRAYYALRNVAP